MLKQFLEGEGMKIEIDVTKTVNENAVEYYERAKKTKQKLAGVKRAIEETRRQLESESLKVEKAPKVRVKRKKKWFEKFRFFKTSDGFLVIAGKDAAQNDLLYSKHLEEGDLFLHADIQGAPTTIIKGGVDAPQKSKEEAAQFAASYSNAWKVGAAAVDVYAVKKEQVSKHAQGGFIGRGAFAIVGDREWFRGTQLGLVIGKNDEGVEVAPEKSGIEFKQSVSIKPGNKEKGELAKSLAGKLECSVDEILQLLPAGKSRVNA